MELTEYHGVPMALTDVAEAVRTDWTAHRGQVDVVRVERPPEHAWPALRASSFVPKPKQVTWVMNAGDSEEAYLAGLTSRERQKIRGARRKVLEAGLRVDVRDVDERLFSEFLRLYERSLADMWHGVSVAAEERDTILADRDAYFAVCATDGARLVGCCLVRRDAEGDMVRVRFSAVAPEQREDSLARVLYLEAAHVTRTLGHRQFSLGTDRNLYGHIAKPGLFRFKSRLGFVPHPSHHVDPAVGEDQADLVLGLTQLTDPALILGYADASPGDRFQLHLFSADPDAELGPYQTRFLHGARAHVVRHSAEPVAAR